jgi:LDH2 family malate/lactate/ureidoglycolate dehydrogenase
MPVIDAETLSDFAGHILGAAGASPAGAELVARSLVGSNLVGHDSHGVVRIRQYLDTIEAGELKPTAEPVIARETATITMVDARHGFGQIAACFAMEKTMGKAQVQGLAATGLFNCNHIGRLGEWVQLAADQGMIGLAFCNGGRPGGLVTPYGGSGRALGTNPIAAAVPIADHPPVVIDFSTSVVAEGKVRVARNKGQAVPAGWIQDAAGRPSTNPDDLYAGGTLLPMAGHKGFGLSLLVELLGGMLTGQSCPGLPGYTVLKNGVLFIVLAIEPFRSPEDFLNDSSALCELVKSVTPAPGFDEVLLPGEPEQRTARRRQAEGIPIDETTWVQLTSAATEFGVAVPDS